MGGEVLRVAAEGNHTGHSHGGCMKDFKNHDEVKAAIMACNTKLNLTDMFHPEDLRKNGFDDKCFMKCVMTERKLAKDDGTIDMTAVAADFAKNAPAGKADALVALMKDCNDATAKDASIAKDPCKAVTKTKLCYMMGQTKICPPPA